MSDTDLKAPAAGEQPPADEASAARLTTAPVESDAPTGIGVLGWLRWTWRQLTSMRVALILLFLLSLAAIPGSLIPQTGENAFQVQTWQQAHKDLTPIYQKLQLFNVYSSVWFSAIYILLFASLAGCIIPRTWQFVGVLRAKPPAAPANLTRMPVYAAWHTDVDPAAAAAAAQRLLRGRRFRAHTSGGAVAAEKGYLREVGNLLFHLSLFALLAGFAWASLASGTGGKLVVQGDGYTNTLTQMDDFSGSAFYGPDDLDPFGFHLDDFTATYQLTGDQMGQPRTFAANVHYWQGSDPTKLKAGDIQVNHPLEIGGSKVFLIGHGYAPVITVKDATGKVVFHDAVPFLPQDANLTSTGVVKVSDYGQKDGKKVQLGFSGFFLPTAPDNFDPTMGPRSLFPGDANPALVLNAYEGDLGTDSGTPQNVYQLDLSHLTQLQQDGQPAAKKMTPGQGWELPDGYGSITFDGYKQWASFSVSHRPGNSIALAGAVLAIVGLIGSLQVQRRRIWVRAVAAPGGRTLVELAGLSRSESAKIAEELAELAVELQDDAPALDDEPDSDERDPDERDSEGPDLDEPDLDEPSAAEEPSAAAPPDTPADATPAAQETKGVDR
ncbi:cytochrome c biogenesis protein ResB [Kitasatospora sp. NBC_01287]|uniref:cytochrome c biogenesis protein ResB n=1 Tax=Kitasatospora sp. NBC_01287 TaxID=2903573 RepID=UPI002252FAE4|nr:cytochrome c biogenesis protein ResB [Kitasatospora sp. NBC_01287]MCX4748359.1 cytochrome c biogenesis protein ResB [Kitasatospora sp. NBC_01287]